MPRGSKPGERRGGRKKGTRNHKIVELEATSAAEGISPLDVMLKAMRMHADADKWDEAANVAKDAAPYVHARLSAVELNGRMAIRRSVRREPMPAQEWTEKHGGDVVGGTRH